MQKQKQMFNQSTRRQLQQAACSSTTTRRDTCTASTAGRTPLLTTNVSKIHVINVSESQFICRTLLEVLCPYIASNPFFENATFNK